MISGCRSRSSPSCAGSTRSADGVSSLLLPGRVLEIVERRQVPLQTETARGKEPIIELRIDHDPFDLELGVGPALDVAHTCAHGHRMPAVHFGRASDLELRRASNAVQAGLTHIYLRDFAQAEQYFARAIAVAPDQLRPGEVAESRRTRGCPCPADHSRRAR